MSFVKASVTYDSYESITYNDQTSQKLNHKGKAGIGYQRPKNSKPSWLKNKLDKDKAKAGSNSFVPNQPRRNSMKVKSSWRKVQPRRDLNGQNMKSTLNRSHHGFAQTLTDSSTGKNVKGPQRKGECAADEPCVISTEEGSGVQVDGSVHPFTMSHSAKRLISGV
ncbi:hypothetical protein F511_20888 [Dorcoceras hygrometricum]|uniref:Uncharacterized protein n=1 Tax=Dorcoceras hygrometricum TaxID=472368 RepID=A0A2Z7D9S1_9LAMI|nr:hypothetical protein F511_20888 [Dorcoceras hygrometricum]